jgi:tetratricopeptide (TPR) repeat protein
MTDWKIVRLFCLIGTLCYGLAPTYASPRTDMTTSPKANSAASFAAPVTFDPQEIADTNRSLSLIKEGDSSLQHSNWKVAQQEYQEALDLWPRGWDALYGLAKCSIAAGDTAKAIEYYRKAVYSTNPTDKGFGETNTTRLMEFALLLNKAGQTAEALFVYNHAAYALDYEDSENHGGKPFLKVLLPEVALEPTSPEQVQYTPERLQALADTALAHEEMGFGSEKEAMAHMKEAVTLYPTSAVTYYYLGEAFPSRTPEQKAAYQKAAELGDEQTAAAAKERLAVLR